MSKTPIKSFEDLQAEKQKLKAEMSLKMDNLKASAGQVKGSITSLQNVLGFANNVKNSVSGKPKSNQGIIESGLETGLNVLLSKLLLKRQNPFIKTVVPLIISFVLVPYLSKKIEKKFNLPST